MKKLLLISLLTGIVVTPSIAAVVKINQTISNINFNPATLVIGSTTTAQAKATSNLAVNFSSTTTTICTTSGNNGMKVTAIAVGTCIIAANQVGNTNYNPAPQVTKSIIIAKANQTINAINLNPTTLSIGSTVNATATATSKLTVIFSSTTPAICTTSENNGMTVTAIAAGNCVIAANQAGNDNYNAALQVTKNINIKKANQTISSFNFNPSTLLIGGSVTVTASATSGLAVSFLNTTPKICNISEDKINGITAGVCLISANQSGNNNYNAAPKVTKSITVGKSTQTISAITFNPEQLTVGSSLTASATATSGLSVLFRSTTPATCKTTGTNGASVTGIATGTCTITAYQPGNNIYNAAAPIAKNVNINANSNSSSSGPSFNMDQTLSDGAQRTTLAFSGLAMMTGNLEAQSFFPPGKVADYTGFQYLRDNDPDHMGHNTSFLTRIANNVIYLLNDSQFEQLKTLATTQLEQIKLYGLKRFPLMKAFRRVLENDIPSGSSGLNLNAVKQASRELYRLDGQISFDRALLYANILNSMTDTQKTYLNNMKGKGWKSWPDISNDQIKTKMQGLPQGTAVAVMTYASDLFSWFAGSVVADVYFCPERHGTYYGSFYIKDAPAIGHEGYSINEQLTATAGAALSDSTKGYVNSEQASIMSSLVETQKNNLYASSTSNIVKVRTDIATLLRNLLTTTANSATVKDQVLALSEIYGNLDGENNYNYALTFAKVYSTLNTTQKAKLEALRQSIMSGTYADGTAFDYSVSTTYFLYSEVIKEMDLIAPYLNNTDFLFFEPSN